MRVDPKAQLAGFPILHVRDALRKISWREWTAEWLQDLLNADSVSIGRLLQHLQTQGLIEPYSQTESWQTTTKGNQFVLATARPVSRYVAQKHFDAFIERITVLRETDEYLYKVRQVYLFGSFLDPVSEIVGDVDLAIELVPKDADENEYRRRKEAYIRRQDQLGRTFKNFILRLYCPTEDVMKFLKSRSRVLSLHPISDIHGLPNVKSKLVYEDSVIAGK